MKKRIALLGLNILLLVLLASPAHGWGDEGHRIVIEAALRSLPQPVRSFYAAQLPFLFAHTSDPDDWSLIDPDEARRHYIDLELLGEDPLADLPPTYAAAQARYGRETLLKAGTVPWTIVEFTQQLAEANRAGDWERSALLAAALSHYAADACMPLHTTVNYKGQLTGSLILDNRTEHRHVHLRYEVAMLRQFRSDIKERVLRRVTPAGPVSEPMELARGLLRESHADIDPILRADRELTDEFGARFDPDFYSKLYQRTGELAAEQLARAARATASLWLGAWQAAGSPDMPGERVAYGEQVVLVERGDLEGARRRVTKVFLKFALRSGEQASAFVVVSADWPKEGRFAGGRKLTEEEYRSFWRELEAASVWELREALGPAHLTGPSVTVTVARGGREHRFSVHAPEAQKDGRYGRIYRAIRAVAPEVGPTEPVGSQTGAVPVASFCTYEARLRPIDVVTR